MGSHYAAINNRRHQAFIGQGALERAIKFAGADGAVWEMSQHLARRLGLTKPSSGQQLREVCIEADTILWSKGKYWTSTGSKPTV